MKVNILQEFGYKLEDVKIMTKSRYDNSDEDSPREQKFFTNIESDIKKCIELDLKKDKFRIRKVSQSVLRVTLIGTNKNHVIEFVLG